LADGFEFGLSDAFVVSDSTRCALSRPVRDGVHAADVPDHNVESLRVRVIAPEDRKEIAVRTSVASKRAAYPLSRAGIVDRIVPSDPTPGGLKPMGLRPVIRERR
jgi:hypothetical protein